MTTVSFHLGDDSSTIDLAGGPLAQHSLERVERLANEIIGEGRVVTTHFTSRVEAEAMLAAGEKKLGVDSALKLDGASVCIQQGTSTELNLADFFRANKMKFDPYPSRPMRRR